MDLALSVNTSLECKKESREKWSRERGFVISHFKKTFLFPRKEALSHPSLCVSLRASSHESERERSHSQRHARPPSFERHRGRSRRSGGRARLSFLFFIIDIGVCFLLPVTLRVYGSPFGQAPRRCGVRAEPRMRRRLRRRRTFGAREVEKGTESG